MNRGAIKRSPSLNQLPNVGTLTITNETPTPTGANTLNRPAQASQSLYQLCLELLERLYCVDGFEEYLEQAQSNIQNNNINNNSTGIGTPTTETPNGLIQSDPVTLLWQTFRLGYPLCALFNAMQPAMSIAAEFTQPPSLTTKPSSSHAKTNQKSVYHFLVACKAELKLKEESMFGISSLYKDDTNDFVKVINTVKSVTDKIEEKGLLNLSRRQLLRSSDPMAPKDNRARVVHELLETERKYVQDMEALQDYARKLQNQEIVNADTIHHLFANLNQLVDFQRRFLIGVETNASYPPSEQRFGYLFLSMEENFEVYQPFCANYQSASELVIQERQNLMQLKDVVEPTYELPSLLIKPIQRICKYPLLLQELLKYTDKNENPYYDEIEQGLKAIKRVTDRVNETRRKQENEAVVKDLERRVEDWKGHNISSFGSLLLEDVFIMQKDDSEREYHVYLFERILLCCKDTSKQNPKNNIIKNNRRQKRASLQLKGRIFIHNITAVVNHSHPGLWLIKVFWRGDTEMESFSLKCRNEEQLKKWQNALEKLLSEHQSSANASSRGSFDTTTSPIKRTGVSSTQLASLQNLDWTLKQSRSQSLPYGQMPQYNGRKTRDENISAPYNWRSNTPPLPNLPQQQQMHHHLPRHPNNMSMPPLPRNGSTTAPPTMASFPSNVVLPNEYAASSSNISYSNNNYLPSSPPSNPASSPQSTRSSTSTGSHPHGILQRRNSEHFADSIAKFMMSTEDDDYITPPPPIQRTLSHSAASGQTFQQTNGSLPLQQQNVGSNIQNKSMRKRSQSSPNIQAIPETYDELVPDLPNNGNIPLSNSNEFHSLATLQRHSGSSTSSQQSVGASTASPTGSASSHSLTSPISNGSINGKHYAQANVGLGISMKIKVNYSGEIFVIVVPQEIEYRDLCERIERKIRLVTTGRDDSIPIRIKYQDEDGDHVTINSDEDVQMAFEGRLAAGGNFVNLYVS
ncbi:10617_t:CDS:2 [Ambispora leptoticha]|uniref:10617_t:CDS:1 n=1 Tax=Ambispora leptoticha TaxID=144679 RepID=A0A9N8VDJ5_9GLOM|nr:10617_t:CDS:2 [Ambispora leptoticha]